VVSRAPARVGDEPRPAGLAQADTPHRASLSYAQKVVFHAPRR
jgi:hypothetical protein